MPGDETEPKKAESPVAAKPKPPEAAPGQVCIVPPRPPQSLDPGLAIRAPRWRALTASGRPRCQRASSRGAASRCWRTAPRMSKRSPLRILPRPRTARLRRRPSPRARRSTTATTAARKSRLACFVTGSSRSTRASPRYALAPVRMSALDSSTCTCIPVRATLCALPAAYCPTLRAPRGPDVRRRGR